MCAGCVSTVEVMAWNAGGAVALAAGGWSRLRWALAGRSGLERRQRAWDDNARFLLGLGHDPTSLLGPRPAAATGDRCPAGADG